MTQRYILDENVMILAQKGENDQGQRDNACLDLITQIIRICHTIVLDSILIEKYYRQLNGLRDNDYQIGPQILSVLNNAFRTEGKIDIRKASPSFPEEESIPDGSTDDTPIIRLAVESRAALVTTDAPLRDDLNSCGIQKNYDLEIYSPEEALKLL